MAMGSHSASTTHRMTYCAWKKDPSIPHCSACSARDGSPRNGARQDSIGEPASTCSPGTDGKSASSVESVGERWLGELPKSVIQGEFSHSEGSKTVGSSHGHFGLIVETLDHATGD